jgi:hypothetical protein
MFCTGFLSGPHDRTDEAPLFGEVRMTDSISLSKLLQEECTSVQSSSLVCQLDSRTGVPLQSRLTASRFLMPFPIGCTDSITNVAAQEALPSIRAVSGAFGIFQLNEHHEAVTTKAGHLAPPFQEGGQWLVPWHTHT